MSGSSKFLSVSRRLRSTPFTSRVEAAGVQTYTVYNHMLLATVFESVEADYWHLCEHVQVWDVSVERQVEIVGGDASTLVQLITPRNVQKAKEKRCFYVPLCDENGGLVNDPIAIKHSESHWWLSIADSDVLLWVKGIAYGAGLDVEIREPDVWPLAIQGPKAEQLLSRVFGDAVIKLRFFGFDYFQYKGRNWVVARSGWSKQGGFEVYVDDAKAGQQLWDELFEKGEDLQVRAGCPNGIERIESGLLSYGNDMTLAETPLQCGLDGFLDLDDDFECMSLEALRRQRKEGVPNRLLLAVDSNNVKTVQDGVLYVDNKNIGQVNSQCYSPRYMAWLAFVQIESDVADYLLQERGVVTHLDGAERMVHYYELPFEISDIFAAKG